MSEIRRKAIRHYFYRSSRCYEVAETYIKLNKPYASFNSLACKSRWSHVRAITLNDKLPKRWWRSFTPSSGSTERFENSSGTVLYWESCMERKEINRTWAKYRISWFHDFHYLPPAIPIDRAWNKEKSKKKVSRRVFATNRIPFLNSSSDNWCRRRRPFRISHGTVSSHIFFHQFDLHCLVK